MNKYYEMNNLLIDLEQIKRLVFAVRQQLDFGIVSVIVEC